MLQMQSEDGGTKVASVGETIGLSGIKTVGITQTTYISSNIGSKNGDTRAFGPSIDGHVAPVYGRVHTFLYICTITFITCVMEWRSRTRS